MKNPTRTRTAALLMYVLYLLAGLVFIAFPSTDALREEANWLGQLVWHLFMVGGAITSAVGVWKANGMIEAIGIPLLVTAMTAYATVLLAGDGISVSTRFGLGVIIMAGCVGLFERVGDFYFKLKVQSDLDKRES